MSDIETQFRSLQMSLAAHRPRAVADRRSEADGDGAREQRRASTVPVVVLTGFLGAGKSTLLAALLSDPPNGMRVRAVVNDVGSLGLDPSLVADASAIDVELTNGCGCCVGGGDLVAAMERNVAAGADLVVLEASGLTDPFAMAHVAAATAGATLDRTVAVVDATRVPQLLDDPAAGPVARRQLDAAQTVVLTNVDRLADAPRPNDPLPNDPIPREVADRCAAVAMAAPGRIITPSTLDAPAVAALLPSSLLGAALPSERPAPAHDFTTITRRHDSSVDSAALAAALAETPATVLRVKGRLRTDGGGVDIQLAGGRASVEPAPAGIDSPGITVVGTDPAAVEALIARLLARN